MAVKPLIVLSVSMRLCLDWGPHLTIGRGYHEPTKIAVRKNRIIALLRALIHVFPVGIALLEIGINWNTYFVGDSIRSLAYYQFVAKVHEMAIQASLAAMLFSHVRYQLVIGNGLPFGALFSGLQISQISYLWSMEFWGSISCNTLSLMKKISLLGPISLTVFLASILGPSSAVLLIPRLAYWPAGSTSIWLNTTSSELWPDRWV